MKAIANLITFLLILVQCAYNYASPALNNNLTSDEKAGSALPAIFVVTGSGAYCSDETGLTVGLNSSEQGVTYKLFRNGLPLSISLQGTGEAITFAPQPGGIYTVTGTNESGTVFMEGNAVITEIPLPVVHLTVDQPAVCQGATINFTILAESLENAVYQWFKNNTPVGSNSPFYSCIPSNGDQIKVDVSNENVCTSTSNIIPVTVFPDSFTTYIINNEPVRIASGTEFTLEAKTFNAGPDPIFKWYVNGIQKPGNSEQFTYIPGTRDTVFVNVTASPESQCLDNNEINSNRVFIYACTAPPIAYNVWGSTENCGDEIFYFGLENTEPGVLYSVFKKSGEDYILIESFSGDGLPYITSGQSGDYWFMGTNACGTTWMNGHALVTNFDTQVYISASENVVSKGKLVTYTAHPRRSTPDNYLYFWIVNGIETAGGSQFTYAPENGDLVTIQMYYPCYDDLHSNNNTILMMVLDSEAHSTTWTGNSNSNWQNPQNWSNGVPVASSIATIPGNLENYPTLIQYASCGSIIIENGSSILGSEYLNYRSALVKRNILSPDFHFLSSPMNYPYPTFGGVFPTNQQTVFARQYHEYTGDWINMKVDNYLNPGTAYSMKLTQPHTAQFIGYLNSQNSLTYLSKINPGNDPERVGWNLIGNPFPCSIDWDMIAHTTIEHSVYVWNGIQYISWNGTVGALSNGIIPPQNGFFVKALESPITSSITIPLSARVHGNVPFYKESIANVIELYATGQDYSDVAFIHLNNNASAGFDKEFDARKLWGINEAPQLFSFADGMELSINELPYMPGDIVELGFKCGISGDYLLEAKSLESLAKTLHVILEDQKEGILNDFMINPKYSFSYISGENVHRFKLHLTETNLPATSEQIYIYSHGKTITIKNFTGLNGEIQIVDLTGSTVMNSTFDNGNISSFKLNASAGIYLVKVITAEGIFTQKVVIL